MWNSIQFRTYFLIRKNNDDIIYNVNKNLYYKFNQNKEIKE